MRGDGDGDAAWSVDGDDGSLFAAALRSETAWAVGGSRRGAFAPEWGAEWGSKGARGWHCNSAGTF